MHIGLTYDLRSEYLAAGYGDEETAEFDHAETIDAIDRSLAALGHRTERIGQVRSLVVRLARGERWDLVFNICEGMYGLGREAQVPALLDAYQIPYTFSDPATLCLCLDKALTKTVLRAAGLATPDWCVVRQLTDVDTCILGFPVIVKPIAEGTGKGVDGASKVTDHSKLISACSRLLTRFKQPVLVERFLTGREFTVAIVGTGSEAKTVGTMEILLRENAEPNVYSYLNKEECEQRCDFPMVRREDDFAVAEAENLAIAAWRVVGGRDAGRIDLRCDETGRPQLMEINPLAGLHPTHSDLPMIWTAAGRDYVELIEQIIYSAVSRVTTDESSMPQRVARVVQRRQTEPEVRSAG
jgi:D-alanine-D-alanine ligase